MPPDLRHNGPIAHLNNCLQVVLCICDNRIPQNNHNHLSQHNTESRIQHNHQGNEYMCQIISCNCLGDSIFDCMTHLAKAIWNKSINLHCPVAVEHGNFCSNVPPRGDYNRHHIFSSRGQSANLILDTNHPCKPDLSWAATMHFSHSSCLPITVSELSTLH